MIQFREDVLIKKVIVLLKKIKDILKSKLSREVIVYLIVGVATTVVNFVSYLLFEKFVTPTQSNIIAWAISVLFAYVTNSRFVFETKPDSFKMELKLLGEFVLARITSGVVENLSFFVFVEKLGYNDLVIKIALSIFVIVFNYVVSKLWIFSKKEKKDKVVK